VKPTRLMSPPGTYFVTFSTWQRRRLFVVEPYTRLFLKTVYGYRRQGKFQLHAFVLMPEHVHLLLTPAEDVTLERSVQLIKGGYSHAFGIEFGKHKEVWQRGFTDHRIRHREDFEKHRQYIHNNPVIRRLVDRPQNIATARHTQDSNWTSCPQRLKPQLRNGESARLEVVPFPKTFMVRDDVIRTDAERARGIVRCSWTSIGVDGI
jgi:putative transposase